MNIPARTLLLAASTLAGAAAAQADITPPPRTYELLVVSADNEGFRDCATFGSDNSLVLQAAKGLVIQWLPEVPASSARNFYAVTDGSASSANPIGLALHGTFVGRDAIRGNAINELGQTFTFSGRSSNGCSPFIHYPDDPYTAAPEEPVQFEPAPGSVAGELYAVRLYGTDVAEDCFHFVINGTLTRRSGDNQSWGMDRLNAGMGTFQAVGASAGPSAGRALRGELNSLGELRVHGIEASSTGLRPIVGSGRQIPACIDD